MVYYKGMDKWKQYFEQALSFVFREGVREGIWSMLMAAGAIMIAWLKGLPWAHIIIYGILTFCVVHMWLMMMLDKWNRHKEWWNRQHMAEEGPAEKLKDLCIEMQELQAYFKQKVDGRPLQGGAEAEMKYYKIEAQLMDKLDEIEIDNPRKGLGSSYTRLKTHPKIMLEYLAHLSPIAYKGDIESAAECRLTRGRICETIWPRPNYWWRGKSEVARAVIIGISLIICTVIYVYNSPYQTCSRNAWGGPWIVLR